MIRSTGSLYHEEAIQNLSLFLDRSCNRLDELDFHSIVVTGLSGMLLGPTLSLKLNKRLIIVRKEDDKSNHGKDIEGLVADKDKWLFLDDLIDTGSTLARVRNKIETMATAMDIEMEFIGSYMFIDNQLELKVL